MKVAVTVPALLADCVGGRREFSVEADRVDQAIAAVRDGFPLLRPHVWDDHGATRKHVLLFYNDTPIRWLDRLDTPLREGDRVTIMQAISGG